MWRPLWRWGGCTGHCPDPGGDGHSHGPPPSTLTEGGFDQFRPEAPNPVCVRGLGWGKACAGDLECQKTVWNRKQLLNYRKQTGLMEGKLAVGWVKRVKDIKETLVIE